MTHPIGYLAYALDRAPGGIARYARELLCAYQQIEFPIRVLNAGSPVLNGSAFSLPGAGLLPGLLTLGQVEIAWYARRSRLNLIHDPTGTAPLSLAKAGRLTTIHDMVPFIYPRTSTILDWLVYRVWQPQMACRLDGIITVSQQSKKDILFYLEVKPERIMVIPEAANPKFQPLAQEYFLPALKRYGIETPYILYVGSLEPRKNLLRLLEGYSQLRSWSDKWSLVIVGARNFWKSSPVVKEVKELGLKSYVRFTGYVPDEDLPAIYSGADLFVFPSIYEGFGLPVLEAMACGIPVVTSNTSSLPEVAGDAALLVDPYSVDEIAAAMRRVLCDPDVAAELCAKGLQRAKQFSWERTARETIAVYEKVLNGEL
jgi:glycosyltransferase involved in cell wall biosynthesis